MRPTLSSILCVSIIAIGALARPAAAQDIHTEAAITSCTWLTPEYPHISSFNLRNGGAIDIKTSTQGECNPSTDPVSVTAQMWLEKRSFGFFWTTYATGVPITKSILNTAQIWRRGELFAVGPCVPGTYRGRLTRSAQVQGGIAFVLGEDIVSPAIDIDCKPKRVSMVIDDTGSMGGVIGSVKESLASFISSTPEDEYTSWSLTTFKDSSSYVGTTEEKSQALAWVSGLTASGGGDCPEDVLGGIVSGLGTLGADPETSKQMLVATDASAQYGDVDGIIAAARANGVRVNVLLTGDCGLESAASIASADGVAAPAALVPSFLSSQVVLKQIATETGGLYFFIPGGTTADFTNALDQIFASIANPAPADSEPPVITFTVTPAVLSPPNHKMVAITPTIKVTDNVDPNPHVELVGVSVTEPDDAQGDGHTANDVQVTPDGQIFVRAERSGQGNGRVYTITVRATDAAGNTAFASANVVVPKSQGAKSR
jgi:hypothetical protein